MERCTFAMVLRIGYNYFPPVIRQLLSLPYVMNKILIRFSTFYCSRAHHPDKLFGALVSSSYSHRERRPETRSRGVIN